MTPFASFRWGTVCVLGFTLLCMAMPVSADFLYIADCGPPAAGDNPLFGQARNAKEQMQSSAALPDHKRRLSDRWAGLDTTYQELRSQALLNDAECASLKAVADATLAKLQSCKAQCDEATANEVNAELAQRNVEYTAFTAKGTIYNNSVASWENGLKAFIADADAGIPKGFTGVVAKWSGNWNKTEKASAQHALLGLKDEGLRNWISANVEFTRSKPDGSPLSADASVLKFKDDFFTKTTTAKQEDLIAFEAGKAFWGSMKNKPVGEGKTLEIWFSGYSGGHFSTIGEMHRTKHGNNDFFTDDRADAASSFAHIFRAYALQLDKPKEREAQQKWDGVIREFRTRIDPLVRDK